MNQKLLGAKACIQRKKIDIIFFCKSNQGMTMKTEQSTTFTTIAKQTRYSLVLPIFLHASTKKENVFSKQMIKPLFEILPKNCNTKLAKLISNKLFKMKGSKK